MKYVIAYHSRTKEKRRIPVSWLTAFGDNWRITPSSRGSKSAGGPVRTKKAAPPPVAPPTAPAAGDESRKDQ